MAAAAALSLSCSGLALLGRQALRQSPQYALRLRLHSPLHTYVVKEERSLKRRTSLRMGSRMQTVRWSPLVRVLVLYRCYGSRIYREDKAMHIL